MGISNLRIGHKLVVALALAIFVAFLIAALVISRIGGRYADEAASTLAATVSTQVSNSVDIFTRELESTADRLNGALAFGYPDRYRLEEGALIRIGERNTPTRCV